MLTRIEGRQAFPSTSGGEGVGTERFLPANLPEPSLEVKPATRGFVFLNSQDSFAVGTRHFASRPVRVNETDTPARVVVEAPDRVEVNLSGKHSRQRF